MDRSMTLAVDVDADPARVFEILSSTEGQRAFWTADCEVSPAARGSASRRLRSTWKPT